MEIVINRGELFRCTKKTNMIKCFSGILCITYEYSRDILIKAGEESIVKKKKNVIIRALKSSVFSIS